MENKERLLLTESTREELDKVLTEDFDSLDDYALIRKINETKKFVARMTESGQIKVQMLLLD